MTTPTQDIVLLPICTGQTCTFPFDTVTAIEVRSTAPFTLIINGGLKVTSEEHGVVGQIYTGTAQAINSVEYTGEVNGFIALSAKNQPSPVIGTDMTAKTISNNNSWFILTMYGSILGIVLFVAIILIAI